MYEALTASALADAAMGAVIDGRFHWDQLPERKRVPAVIAHDVATAGIRHTMKGRVPTGEFVVQIDCWAVTKAEAVALRLLALAWLDGLKGPVLQAFPERTHASWDHTPGAGSDRATSLYRASVDVRLWHHPTA